MNYFENLTSSIESPRPDHRFFFKTFRVCLTCAINAAPPENHLSLGGGWRRFAVTLRGALRRLEAPRERPEELGGALRRLEEPPEQAHIEHQNKFQTNSSHVRSSKSTYFTSDSLMEKQAKIGLLELLLAHAVSYLANVMMK